MLFELIAIDSPIIGTVAEIKNVPYGSRQPLVICIRTKTGRIRSFQVSDERLHQAPEISSLIGQAIRYPEDLQFPENRPEILSPKEEQMARKKKFIVPVIMIGPGRKWEQKKTANFPLQKGQLKSVSEPNKGFYEIEISLPQKRPRLSLLFKKKRVNTEPTAHSAAWEREAESKRTFCLESATLTYTVLENFIGKKVTVSPNLITVFF